MNNQKGEVTTPSALERIRDYSQNVATDNSTPLADLGLDSLELIEAVFELEQQQGRSLSNAELAALITVDDFARLFDFPCCIPEDS
jgi:acyl carrier protein